MQAAADANDRSLTQEIEQRLERSLERDALAEDVKTARLLDAIGAEIAGWTQHLGKPWHQDNITFHAMREGVKDLLDSYAPRIIDQDEVFRKQEALILSEKVFNEAKIYLQSIGAWVAPQPAALSGMFGSGGFGAALLSELTAPENEYDNQARRLRVRGMRHDDGTDYTEDELKEVERSIYRLRELEEERNRARDAFLEAYQPQDDAAKAGAALAKTMRRFNYSVRKSVRGA